MTARGKERRLTAAIQSWRLSALESRYEREASSANAVAAARDAVLQAEINKSASEADELHGVCTELARRVRSVEEDLEEARASEAAARAEVARLQAEKWPSTLRSHESPTRVSPPPPAASTRDTRPGNTCRSNASSPPARMAGTAPKRVVPTGTTAIAAAGSSSQAKTGNEHASPVVRTRSPSFRERVSSALPNQALVGVSSGKVSASPGAKALTEARGKPREVSCQWGGRPT